MDKEIELLKNAAINLRKKLNSVPAFARMAQPVLFNGANDDLLDIERAVKIIEAKKGATNAT